MNRRIFLASAAAAGGGCGYHVGGKADLMPKNIQTIAIPALNNLTMRHKFADRLAAALAREFIGRTRYHVIADPAGADAVLSGTIVNYFSFPVVYDPTIGRASGVQIQVTVQLSLTERATGKVLFSRPNFDIRERYEVSVDQAQYFEESDQALERVSRDVARTVVSSVLSGF
jgi:hypothetical protein